VRSAPPPKLRAPVVEPQIDAAEARRDVRSKFPSKER
jgi:hypothetical protein